MTITANTPTTTFDLEIARRVSLASRDATDVATQEVACIPGVAAVASLPSGMVALGLLGHVSIVAQDDAVDLAGMMVAAAQGAQRVARRPG